MRGARPVFQGGGGAGALGRRKGALGGQIAVQRLKQLDEDDARASAQVAGLFAPGTA